MACSIINFRYAVLKIQIYELASWGQVVIHLSNAVCTSNEPGI
jgi:hypothetical protein